ncbi:hypothetical protein JTB14_004958 [Gonioctena quinquepunctata]|nr:hypothetical protein JTB14_004958 [Gonioctena quinquepunctata]
MSRSEAIKGEDDMHRAVENLAKKLCTSVEFLGQLANLITENFGEKLSEGIEMLEKENKVVLEKLENQQSLIDTSMHKREYHERYI